VALMARKKSASFVGVPVRDADVDAPSYTRDLGNIVGDVALTFDKMTGQNAEPNVIVHDGGSGTGARLHIPLVNQYVGRSLMLTAPSGKGSAGGPGVTRLLSYPIHLCPGEDRLFVEMALTCALPVSTFAPYVQVCTSANVEEANVDLQPADHAGEAGSAQGTFLRCIVTGLTAGDHLLFINIDTTDLTADDSLELLYCRIHPHVGPHVTASPELPLGDDKWGCGRRRRARACRSAASTRSSSRTSKESTATSRAG
jgi:hypothetical protein